MSNDYWVERSWAAEPLFYRAPHPPGTQPREYQHAAVEYALARDHCLVGDAPGLGKTVEAVLLSNAIRAPRTLVVCPASLRLNWEREIWRWSTIPNVRTYATLAARDGVSPEAHYQVISYDLLRNRAIFDALMALRWDHLVLDEAHYLKDPKGNSRTEAVCGSHDAKRNYYPGLVDACGRRTLLSGTIMPNQPIECYNAVRLLDWDAVDRMSLDSFRDYYYGLGEGFVTRRVWDGKKYIAKTQWSNRVRNAPRNLDELRVRLRSGLMVRRLKEHVMRELPPRQWHVFPLAPTAAVRKALKHPGWAKVEHLYEMDSGAFDTSVPIDGEISTARRLLGEAKAPEVADYVRELLREGVQKVVVGAWHLSVLKYLRKELAGYGLVYMDGSTSPRQKQQAVDEFQENDSVRIIEGQIKPLGMGWNLSAAQDVVLAEPDWVPGTNDQLLDRPHRTGQVGDHVTGHVPIVAGTIEERILGTAITKDVSINRALDGG